MDNENFQKKMSERKGTKGLELWCKRLVKDCPNVQIDNMTTSWRNGIAFCALVHHFRPDLIDLSTLKPENIYENNQLAFSIAEKQLGIPALLDPEDMVENEIPDRLSILTYLSQFYRLLGHKVKAKSSENEKESKVLSSPKTEVAAPVQFGKTGLDKCAACGLPVYLAQRLFAAHKLYHRSCFRCSNCLGHLNPKTFHVIEGSDFCCDSCKNEKTISKYLNNNDQIGMLAFNDDTNKTNTSIKNDMPILSKSKSRPQSILEKINMFEKGIQKDKTIDDKLSNLSLRNCDNIQTNETSNGSALKENNKSQDAQIDIVDSDLNLLADKYQDGSKLTNIGNKDCESNLYSYIPEIIYKSNVKKSDFLQTQLSDSTLDNDSTFLSIKGDTNEHNKKDCYDKIVDVSDIDGDKINETPSKVIKPQCNITDDNRIANSHSVSSKDNSSTLLNKNEEIGISVPPRRKKQQSTIKVSGSTNEKVQLVHNMIINEYPDNLNPFSDDDDEEKRQTEHTPKKVSTNPFGSSDEEEDVVPPILVSKAPTDQPAPIRRLISANPFWSDGEEPSSDEDTENGSSKMYKSPLTTSTPNLPTNTTRRKKPRAPPPPLVSITPAADHVQPSTSMDDLASISSVSSFNSTAHSDYKSSGKRTPSLKKQQAPTPADSLSTVSCSGSIEKGVDTSGTTNNSSEISDIIRKVKGPAPGLPLPQRREVKLQLSPEELQIQLDMLETQQLGLERQGVLIEQMIRTKCEGDDAAAVPQEEVEDLVIQLCEIVNEKNDLFRKQTELMYIRRQQRLEQEQADIEHEIRIIQSRPTVNRIDADKAREEQLVCRLVEIVRLRDELVQQLDSERQRERREDQAIAASIAHRRAQRNSDSTSCSSMKSLDVVSPKKNKMKDKVKKQLKKAKHTFIPKKKESLNQDQQNKVEKEKEKKSK